MVKMFRYQMECREAITYDIVSRQIIYGNREIDFYTQESDPKKALQEFFDKADQVFGLRKNLCHKGTRVTEKREVELGRVSRGKPLPAIVQGPGLLRPTPLYVEPGEDHGIPIDVPEAATHVLINGSDIVIWERDKKIRDEWD